MSDLITTSQLSSALAAGGRPVTGPQTSQLSNACAAASGIARKLMNGRDITRQTYIETHEPTQDGRLFLGQMPVLRVSRIAGGRSTAITIQAAATMARASVAFAADANADDPPIGLTLVSVAGGYTAETQVAFASDIATLGSAVSAVPGWSATVAPWAAGLPCSDLVDASVASSALGGGAQIAAYATDVPAEIDRRTGILVLRDDRPALFDPLWWPQVGGVSGDVVNRGKVRVWYEAGFSVVPDDVVAGVVLIAMALLDRWSADFTIMEEDLGNTRYKRVSPELLMAVPREARGYLLPYRIGRV